MLRSAPVLLSWVGFGWLLLRAAGVASPSAVLIKAEREAQLGPGG
jgi:hypothetical protein